MLIFEYCFLVCDVRNCLILKLNPLGKILFFGGGGCWIIRMSCYIKRIKFKPCAFLNDVFYTQCGENQTSMVLRLTSAFVVMIISVLDMLYHFVWLYLVLRMNKTCWCQQFCVNCLSACILVLVLPIPGRIFFFVIKIWHRQVIILWVLRCH